MASQQQLAIECSATASVDAQTDPHLDLLAVLARVVGGIGNDNVLLMATIVKFSDEHAQLREELLHTMRLESVLIRTAIIRRMTPDSSGEPNKVIVLQNAINYFREHIIGGARSHVLKCVTLFILATTMQKVFRLKTNVPIVVNQSVFSRLDNDLMPMDFVGHDVLRIGSTPRRPLPREEQQLLRHVCVRVPNQSDWVKLVVPFEANVLYLKRVILEDFVYSWRPQTVIWSAHLYSCATPADEQVELSDNRLLKDTSPVLKLVIDDIESA